MIPIQSPLSMSFDLAYIWALVLTCGVVGLGTFVDPSWTPTGTPPPVLDLLLIQMGPNEQWVTR